MSREKVMKHPQRGCLGVPELKQHYLFRERTGNDPLAGDYSFQQHERTLL